jgi:SNF2 family DNA or RNA helicase
MEGMGKSVTQEQQMLAQQRTDELSLQLMEFSLRRTADVLEQYLPKKREIIVFFKLTPLQKLWYDRLLETTKTC